MSPHATATPTRQPSDGRPTLALLLLGGGARAAYQVGFLRCLARRMPEVRFRILTGVSSGAINIAHLASRRCPFPRAVEELTRLWRELEPDDVMRVDSLSLARNALLWGIRLVSGGYGHGVVPEARALVDCQPLASLLTRHLAANGDGEGRADAGGIPGIRRNLEDGHLDAVALATTSYSTGASVTFVQGRELPHAWTRRRRVGVSTVLTVDHVLASASLPLIFPAVRIGDAWYGDGGVRQGTPLSPAIALGADRIVAISTHHAGDDPPGSRPSLVRGYPPPAQIAGTLLNSVFLDRLHDDLRRLRRVNALLREAEGAPRGDLRPVDAFVLRPSVDLGRMARDHESALPRAFRWMVRGLGTGRTESPDLLSMVLFEPGYLRRLIEVGERDAQARGPELEAFLRSAAPA